MGRKAKLNAETRRRIARELLRGAEPIAALARKYGVSDQTLYRWQREFLASDENPLAAEPSDGEASTVEDSSPEVYACILDSFLRQCPECGSNMTADYRNPRTVTVPIRVDTHFSPRWTVLTLRLSSRIRRCHNENPRCGRFLVPYRPEIEGRIALPQRKLSLGILDHLYRLNLKGPSIRRLQAMLSSSGIDLAHSTVDNARKGLPSPFNLLAEETLRDEHAAAMISEFLKSRASRKFLLLDVFRWQRASGRLGQWLVRDCLSGEVHFTDTRNAMIVAAALFSASPIPIRGVLAPQRSSIPACIRRVVPRVRQRHLPIPDALAALPEAFLQSLDLPVCYSEVLPTP
jgi:transposase-like protein